MNKALCSHLSSGLNPAVCIPSGVMLAKNPNIYDAQFPCLCNRDDHRSAKWMRHNNVYKALYLGTWHIASAQEMMATLSVMITSYFVEGRVLGLPATEMAPPILRRKER